MDFGFTINQPRTIGMDAMDNNKLQDILRSEPTLLLCIGCGTCSATCTAGALMASKPFGLRQSLHLIRRGAFDEARQSLNACMLCGKCRMVCPRGVNTRAAIAMLLRIL